MSPLTLFCIGYYALAVLSGARSAVFSERTAGDVVIQMALAICLGVWAVADARQREKPIPRSQQLWLFILAAVVVPGYVIITRGWKGIGWVGLHTVSWVVLWIAAMHTAGFIYFGNAWWPVLGFKE